MEAIPWGFKSPLSHRLAIALVLTGLGQGCAPDVREAAGRLRVAVEASSGVLSRDVEDALDPASRRLLREASFQKWLPEVLQSLRTVLTNGRVVAGEWGLLRTDEPSQSLYFVRDGHGVTLNLALSGAWFCDLHALQYPRPW